MCRLVRNRGRGRHEAIDQLNASARRRLDHFRGRQPAGLAADLDLQRCVVDAEPLRKLGADAMQEDIVVSSGPHQMRGQRGLAGAHRPDVEVVNLPNPGHGGKLRGGLVDVDPGGCDLHEDPQGLPHQAPGAGQDEQPDPHRDDRVDRRLL